MSHGIIYRSVRNPVWNHDGKTIDCVVKFDHIDAEVPFTATPYDEMDYGREIFERARRGDFGPVGKKPRGTTSGLQVLATEELPTDLAAYLNSANTENSGNGDRGTVVAGVSMLEDVLGTIVAEAGLMPAGAGRRRPPFGGLIKLLASRGIITPVESSQLDSIRELRNIFAHRVSASLIDPEIAAICDDLYRELGIPGVRMPLARQRFAAICMTLMIRLRGRRGASGGAI